MFPSDPRYCSVSSCGIGGLKLVHLLLDRASYRYVSIHITQGCRAQIDLWRLTIKRIRRKRKITRKTKKENQLKDKNTVSHNNIFEVVLNT
jgi:hypothetical protein